MSVGDLARRSLFDQRPKDGALSPLTDLNHLKQFYPSFQEIAELADALVHENFGT
jgi:hypothetical protein